MCIALLKPADVVLSEQILNNCFSSNPHGAGFAYAEDGNLFIRKGFFSVGDLIAAFEPHKHKAALVHFRIASHGDINAFNTHPWLIETTKYQFALIHNGILEHRSTKDMSDTGFYCQDVLQPMLEKDPDYLFTEAGRDWLGAEIGYHNKFALLRNDGRVSIINADRGEWSDRVWYSNGGYKERPAFKGFRQTCAPLAMRSVMRDDDTWPGRTVRYGDDVIEDAETREIEEELRALEDSLTAQEQAELQELEDSLTAQDMLAEIGYEYAIAFNLYAEEDADILPKDTLVEIAKREAMIMYPQLKFLPEYELAHEIRRLEGWV